MRLNEYKSLDEFMSQYTGEWGRQRGIGTDSIFHIMELSTDYTLGQCTKMKLRSYLMEETFFLVYTKKY